MNLAELVSITLEHLDNPDGDLWDPARTALVVNEGYEDIAGIVDASGKEFNVYPHPVLLAIRSMTFDEEIISEVDGTISLSTVNKIPREWAIVPQPERKAIRRILDVERYDATGTIGSLDLVGWQERNNQRDRNYPTLVRSHATAYAYRSDTGIWMLGIVEENPRPMTLRVWYAPVIARLVNNADIPTQVPQEFHSLIAIRAALIGKQQEQRDPGWLLGRYAERKMDLVNSLSNIHTNNKSRPWR